VKGGKGIARSQKPRAFQERMAWERDRPGSVRTRRAYSRKKGKKKSHKCASWREDRARHLLDRRTLGEKESRR